MDTTAQQLKERIQSVYGRLLMVDFNANDDDWYQCTVHQNDGLGVPCTFDDDLADEVERALRHDVVVFGLATIDTNTDHIITLHIGELHIINDDVTQESLDQSFANYSKEHDSLAGFREAFGQAMRSETYPISELWKMVDNPDEDKDAD